MVSYIKYLLDSKSDNIKKMCSDIEKYQQFFNFYDIITPAYIIYEKENPNAVGISFTINKSINTEEYKVIEDYVEIDLRHIIKKQFIDVITSINISNKEIYDFEVFNYSKGGNMTKVDIENNYIVITSDKNYKILIKIRDSFPILNFKVCGCLLNTQYRNIIIKNAMFI